MNAVFYEKQTGRIAFVITDAKRKGEAFTGPSGEIAYVSDGQGVRWTMQEVQPGANIETVTPAPEFRGQPVGSRADVEKVLREQIRAKYSVEDEFSLLRLKIFGLSSPELLAYGDFAGRLLSEARSIEEVLA